MRTQLFDFELPEDRIALHPMEPRDKARLLLVRPGRAGEGLAGANENEPAMLVDKSICDLPDFLREGDVLVFNDTRVIPAALSGIRLRKESRAQVSFNLHKRLDGHRWKAFARPAKRLAVGDSVQLGSSGGPCYGDTLDARIDARGDNGEVTLKFMLHGAYLDDAIKAHGRMPLPPYIASKRASDGKDEKTYQTIYARHDGAVAAPTAGLHFTETLMAALEKRGIAKEFLTLHVGGGTFLPVKTDDTDAHVMHEEWGEITEETAAALNECRARGGRIIAVGTTSLRLLETAGDSAGFIRPFSGDTDIFITPGYRFGGADLLVTNFHLPRSTLFMLVAAFAGLNEMKAAYAHAMAQGYRFYSYGDACLLYPGLPQQEVSAP